MPILLQSEIEQLKLERCNAYKRVKSTYRLLILAEKLTSRLRTQYERNEKAYEEIDLKLAEVDGRMNKIESEPKTASKWSKYVDAMTNQERLELAEKLGLDVKIEIPD